MAAARPFQPPTPDIITGVILAGGRASRLGGVDKGLVAHAGRALVDWVIAALRPQVRGIIINANRNQDRYQARGWPVIADRLDGFQGPLAGIASALAAVDTPWIVTLPCDGPAPPADLVERLCRAVTDPLLLIDDGPDGSGPPGFGRPAADNTAMRPAEMAVAGDGRRLQPVHALIPRALAPDLDAFLAGGGRRVDRWYARHRTAVADFSDQRDAFANINTAEDAARAARAQALRP